jgi:hypothetical protein
MTPRSYRITVRGRLTERFAEAFRPAVVRPREGATDLLTGAIDQSELHGLLARVRDLGLELCRLQEVEQ